MRRAAVAAAVTLLLGCDTRSAPQNGIEPTASSPSSDALAASSPNAVAPSDGHALVEKYECQRCHTETGLADAPREKHCVRCHDDIHEGRFTASPALLGEWHARVAPLRHAPSLGGVGTLVDRAWAARFLRAPFDLRPGLHPEMPRLALDAPSARAIVDYLADRNAAAHPELAPRLELGDLSHGRQLFLAKGCATCHVFTGAGTPAPPAIVDADGPSRTLAPDLRFARERLVPAVVATWIQDPASVKTGAAMPKPVITDAEARDLAAFVLDAPLAAPKPLRPAARLPILERSVGYDEVADRVLHKICWHCHSQPDYARGDGGPGNTGGFGFAPRKLDLSTYEALSSGWIDDRGERASIFAKAPSGESLLVAALIARDAEERGELGPTRGMPLGLPPLSEEDVQLVETWVAQGHPR